MHRSGEARHGTDPASIQAGHGVGRGWDRAGDLVAGEEDAAKHAEMTEVGTSPCLSLTVMEATARSLAMAEPRDGGGDGMADLILDDDEGILGGRGVVGTAG